MAHTIEDLHRNSAFKSAQLGLERKGQRTTSFLHIVGGILPPETGAAINHTKRFSVIVHVFDDLRAHFPKSDKRNEYDWASSA